MSQLLILHMGSNKNKTGLFLFSPILLTGLIVFFLDQTIKHKIRSMGGFYVCNNGISFGLFFPNLLFWLFSILLIILFFLYLNKEISSSKSLFIGLGFLFGGVFSNLNDRVFFGCVFDYITINIWGGFPIFNIADIAILIGGIFIVIITLRNKKWTNC